MHRYLTLFETGVDCGRGAGGSRLVKAHAECKVQAQFSQSSAHSHHLPSPGLYRLHVCACPDNFSRPQPLVSRFGWMARTCGCPSNACHLLSLSAADSVVVLNRKPCAAHASVQKRDATPRWSKGIQKTLLLRCCSQNGLAGARPRAGRERSSGLGCLEAVQKQVFGFPLEESALSAPPFPLGTQTM